MAKECTCTFCEGEGRVCRPVATGSDITDNGEECKTCPVCKGTGKLTATELDRALNSESRRRFILANVEAFVEFVNECGGLHVS